MNLKEANRKLNKLGYNIRSDEGYNYDSGKTFYDTWVEYRRNDGKWGVLNAIGKFDTQDDGVAESVGWIKQYTNGEVDVSKKQNGTKRTNLSLRNKATKTTARANIVG